MLFAAGFGTRMGDLTKDRPKPLIEVAGMPLIDHTLELAKAVEPRNLVANTHYLAEQIANHLAETSVAISHEPEILETGGGLRHALPLLGGGPVFTANTDAIWKGPNPFTILRDAWREEDMDALLLCVPSKNAIGHAGNGDFLIDPDGRLTRGQGAIYGGIQIIRTEGLVDIQESAFSLNVLWNRMAENNRLLGVMYPGQWCDVGSAKGIELANKMLGVRDV